MAQKKEEELLYDPQGSVAGGGSKTGVGAAAGSGRSAAGAYPGTGAGAAGKNYSGGTQVKYGDDFTYQSAPEYVSKYQNQIDELTKTLLNRDKFEYNPENDPLYQQYAQSYAREGQRAMQDTLGQVSARTGGLASSYATSAAQQTYDNYMAALADKIPELKQLAYSMYMDDYNTQANNLQLLNALEQGDFGKYQSLLNQYNADRNFQYGVYADDWNRNYTTERDKIADDRYGTEWNYGLERDKLADKRYDTEWNYGLERDKLADKRYDQEWNYGLERDKLADQRYNQEWNYQLAQNAARAASGGAQRSAAYDDVEAQALKYDDLDEAVKYLDRMLKENLISEEESKYIYSVKLGGDYNPPEEEGDPFQLVWDAYNNLFKKEEKDPFQPVWDAYNNLFKKK